MVVGEITTRRLGLDKAAEPAGVVKGAVCTNCQLPTYMEI